MKAKVELLYRCGGNWKTFFDIEVDSEQHSKILTHNVGDEITMGDLGTPSQDEFFGGEHHEYSYDDQLDHNLLEIVEINWKS